MKIAIEPVDKWPLICEMAVSRQLFAVLCVLVWVETSARLPWNGVTNTIPTKLSVTHHWVLSSPSKDPRLDSR